MDIFKFVDTLRRKHKIWIAFSPDKCNGHAKQGHTSSSILQDRRIRHR